MAWIDHHTRAMATTGPNACSLTAVGQSPVRAALVARVRKQVGQGTPVRRRKGQLNPGSQGCQPFSHNPAVRVAGSKNPASRSRRKKRFTSSRAE